MADTPPTPRGVSPRVMLALLFLINLGNFYDRQILAVLMEPIRKEFGLGDQAIGWLNTAFVLFYAAVGLPIGRWSDRFSRVKILAGGVGVWSLFTALSGLATGYWSMFVARLGVGAGEASCSPAANSLLGDLFPPQQRARAISTFMLGLPIGIFLSSLLSGLVARTYGWRMAFFVATVPGIILAVIVARLAEPPRGAHEPVAPAAGGFWAPYLQLARIPTLRWIVLSGALHNFNAYIVSGFAVAYLMRWHRLPLAQASSMGAVMLGATGLVGLVAFGTLADRVHQWRRGARLTLGAVCIAVQVPLTWLAVAQPAGAAVPFAVLLGIGWSCFYGYYATVYASVHDVVPPNLRASAMSLYFFWMYVLGGAFGTAILGAVSDRAAKAAMTAAGATEMTEAFRATGLHEAFYMVPAAGAVLALVLFAASRTIKKDMLPG